MYANAAGFYSLFHALFRKIEFGRAAGFPAHAVFTHGITAAAITFWRRSKKP